MPELHFRSHNLVATIDIGPVAIPPCPSRTCCSAFKCFYSILMPGPELTPPDLPAVIRDLRTKLDVEKHGIDLALTVASGQDVTQWQEALESQGLRRVEGSESA